MWGGVGGAMIEGTCGCWDYAKEIYAVGEKRGIMFFDGPGMEGCGLCNRCADYLCDYPLGKGKTCDTLLCEAHAIVQWEAGSDLHFCPNHVAVIADQTRAVQSYP